MNTKFIKPLILSFFLLLIFGFGYQFRPIIKVYAEDCAQINGKVKSVHLSATNDFVIAIDAETKKRFYINRGVEAGLNYEEVFDDINEKDVSIWYVKRKSILGTENSTKHISRLVCDQKVIFNEILDYNP